MNRKIELLTELSNLEKEHNGISNTIKRKQQELAELCCPYKPGQIFTCTQKDNLRRKVKTERAVLKFVAFYFRPPYYELVGVKLNKDGSESKRDPQKLYSFDKWVPEEKGDREGNTQA